ncbi:hypothetical protein BHE74_00041038 [Ensete ventricosum]|uniref:Uncharacterized protein n=1 Tax=Ensete ventricosum TaxID=4639 RepID=A0A426XJ99_ENSVE|nr:hypothetical protein B296_00034427 [Ensete ventricosum]RWW52528.1 hypothetical protein BHE74_00041038 [Ensete ventricosum]
MVINVCEVASRVEFRSIFCAPSRKFKILVIPVLLAHGKSYKHGFMKKCDSHKFARSRTLSRISIDFSCTISEIQNTDHCRRISP